MMLTTNRIAALDTAFESRLDIVLTYNDLDEVGRAKIWTNFFINLPADSHSIDPEGLALMAQSKLTGRQIKSAIKTALLLAAKEKTPLAIRHVELVVGLWKKACELMYPRELQQGRGDEIGYKGSFMSSFLSYFFH